MEPWLDSLSEDWNSEPRVSSPASSIANKSRFGTNTTSPTQSHSRIPHLSQSLRKDSLNGSYLKPRSTRGIAKSKNIPILSERSPSSLNVVRNTSQGGSHKRRSSALPRRTSSAFSDSQQSVQHHTIDSVSKANDTPEWKKRIVNGEDVTSDGFDLFSPSKLEGIFAQPTAPRQEPEKQSSVLDANVNPWSSLRLANFTATTEQYHSLRASRSRAPAMEALEEVSEDEKELPDVSAVPSNSVNNESLQGLVRQRVDSLEQVRSSLDKVQIDHRTISYASKDPRWRTSSGQQEIRNEYISPVTVSARNTMREKAIQKSVNLNPEILKQRLMETSQSSQRPSSRSSDRDVSYAGGIHQEESLLHDEPLLDMTSHSLPEDLSMGTQEFISQGGYVNARRGAPSSDVSILRRRPSSSVERSRLRSGSKQNFRSSPPPYETSKDSLLDQSKMMASLPGSPEETSIVHHGLSPTRPASEGSPLKLFGNRDTYTNNKLLRVLSQFEQMGSDLSPSPEKHDRRPKGVQLSDTGLRMSQFGKGELDTFSFEQDVGHLETVEHSILPDDSILAESERIFQDLAAPSLNGGAAVCVKKPEEPVRETEAEVAAKRLMSSPAKDRTSKRRRTMLKDEIVVEGINVEIRVDQVPDKSIAVAGRKRKDARPGEDGGQADPQVLASRTILRPKAGSRNSSTTSQNLPLTEMTSNIQSTLAVGLTEALAAELESFAQGVSEAVQDSRKPSLATKDYMEEANKVMEFIRARGKPKLFLPEIQEPSGLSEVMVDDTFGFDVDNESTKDSFSRPPSRERSTQPREDRRHAKHDPRIASHLRKYQETDDLELLAGTSTIGTLPPVDNEAADKAALVPVPGDEQESSPPNIRILNHDENLRKRKHSESTTHGQQTQNSSGSSSRHTFATESSSSSGQKGMITSGTVSIPDQVGTMTFDHEKQIWVKQQLLKHSQIRPDNGHTPSQLREATLDDDPFDSIPDLSIDEQREAAMRVIPKSSSRPSTAETVRHFKTPEESGSVQPQPQKTTHIYRDMSSRSTNSGQRIPSLPLGNEIPEHQDSQPTDVIASQPEASKHEERLHDGVPSKEPVTLENVHRQPRVVTIAFSSPIASEIPQPKTSVSSELVSDDEDFLPPEDSDLEENYVPASHTVLESHNPILFQDSRPVTASVTHRERDRPTTLDRRPVSRIDECDELEAEPEGMSLVRVSRPVQATPKSGRQHATANETSAYKGTSILCLTPLSEFTMHHVDRTKLLEESFVAARPHPKALLQAHGSLNLAVDALVKAITDAVPTELFWEQLRGLDLTEKRLTSLHSLHEYCPTLETLVVPNNSITQLNGIPSTLRQLNISHNCLNDFTSWGSLNNLQYVDISNNQLESLEGFNSLVHLRSLKACNNQIRDIEGVLDLDGLISLDLSGNQLSSIDFEGVDLPRLQELDLSNNSLTTVQNLQCLPRLDKVDISSNSLRDFSVSEPMTFLKMLTLAQNYIESLDLHRFPAIEFLDVDDNCLHTLHGLQVAQNLRRLSVRAQQISSEIINHVLTTPNECTEILLSSNVLNQGQLRLPSHPHYNLRCLELAACGLRELPKGFGNFFPNCRSLNLNFNALQELGPLMGCVKLRYLALAENRIKRLRRTCLTIARISHIERLDLRDNPLTVGFYTPLHGSEKSELYTLPMRPVEHDSKWLQTLDEVTNLRRQTIQLLLAENCKELKQLDGAQFKRVEILELDMTWSSLMTKGVLVKAIEASPENAPAMAMSFEQENAALIKIHTEKACHASGAESPA